MTDYLTKLLQSDYGIQHDLKKLINKFELSIDIIYRDDDKSKIVSDISKF